MKGNLHLHMILEESPAIEANPTFFEVFAQLVRESRLAHAEITRRINEKSKFHALYLGKKKAGSSQPKYEMFHQGTLTRIVNGRDLPTNLTLYRIARLGLDLSEEQCMWLELLRLEEEYVNHSTTQARIVVSSQISSCREDQGQDDDEIAWIREKEKAGLGD